MSERAMALARDAVQADYGRDFRLFVAGRAVSTVGDRVAKIALIFLVIRLANGFAPAVGLVYVAQLAPSVVGGLPVGVLVDQLDRRQVMVVCDGIRALLMVCVPALTTLGLGTVYPVVAALYAFTLIFDTAAAAAIADVVPSSRLTSANAVLTGIEKAGDMAYAAGGALIVIFGYQLPFYFDALTFAFSGLMILMMRVPRHRSERVQSVGAIVQRVSDGVFYIWHQPFLKSRLLALGVGAIAGGMAFVLTPLYANKALAASPGLVGPLQGGAFRFSVLEVALGVGLLVGSVGVTKLSTRSPRGLLFAAGMSIFGLAYGALALVTNLYVAALLLVGAGFGNALFVICGFTLLQQLTPSEMRGRVDGASMTVITSSLALGSIAAGGLLLVFPFSTLWALVGAILIFASSFGWLRSDVRSQR